MIEYQGGNLLFLEDKIFAFVLRLQVAIQTIVAWNIGELDNKRRLSKNVTQIVQKENNAFFACFAKSTVASEALLASLGHDHDEAFIACKKIWNRVYRGLP